MRRDMQIFAIFFPTGLPLLVAAEKAVAVRQGFDWNASLFTPLWAIQHSLWITLALWTGVTAAFAVLVAHTHLDSTSALLVYTLMSSAFGCEADRVRELKLLHSGYALQGLSFGNNAEDAEDLYIQCRVHVAPQDEATASNVAADSRIDPSRHIDPPKPMDPPTPGGSDLLGLFSSRET